MNKLSKIEWLRGFVATLLVCFKIGWYGLSVATICGIIWMLGGSIEKIIRRLGVPLFVICTSLLFNWWAIWTLFVGYGILCLGDGYPDHNTGDSGSWLGRQVEKLGWPSEISGELTKWIPVLLFQLALLPIYLG